MTGIHQSATEEKMTAGRWLILMTVVAGTFTTALDASIVNTVLPTITTSFHTDIAIVQWVPTVYLLTISCFLLLWGRLGDIIGHRRIFLYGLAAFTIASVICGSSQNIGMLIAFRVLQGVAASMIMAVGVAIVTANFPGTERGKAIGIYAMGGTVALALGPTLGGIIAEHLSWRYIFFINVPIGIVAVLSGARFIPRGSTNPGQRLDFPGALAIFVFLPTLLLYFNRGEEWGWTAPLSLAMLITAVAFGLLFLCIERRSEQPMLNPSLFANRVFSFASLSHVICYMGYMAVIFMTPFFLKFVLDYSIFKVGLVMATVPIAFIIVSPLSGTFSDRVGTRVFVIGGACIVALDLFLFSGLKESATVFDVVWRLAVFGMGMAMFATPNISTIMGNVPPQHLGIASGVFAAMRNIGMVFGIAVLGAILHFVAPISTSADPGSFDSHDVNEFLNGLHWAYIAGSLFVATAALTSVFAIRRRSRSRDS